MDRASFGSCTLSIWAFRVGLSFGVALNPGERLLSPSRQPPQAAWGEVPAMHVVARWSLSLAPLIRLIVVALGANRAVVGVVEYRWPPSCVTARWQFGLHLLGDVRTLAARQPSSSVC